MGLDVYAQVVLGVRLYDVAKENKETLVLKRYDNITGEPYDEEETTYVLTDWRGRRFDSGIETWDKGLPKLRNLTGELKSNGLSLYWDKEFVRESNVIGMAVGVRLDYRGGILTIEYPDIALTDWLEVKKRLKAVGIEADPKAFLVMTYC